MFPEHLELRSLHSNGPCLASLATLTRLRSLALGGRLLIGTQGLSALRHCKLPQLEALSITGLHASSLMGRALRAMSAAHAAPAAAPAAASAGAGPSSAHAVGLSAIAGVQTPACIDELLGVLASSFEGLQVLDVGACWDLTTEGLCHLAGALKRLQYLQLREQSMGWEEVQHALADAPELRWCGAVKGDGPKSWSAPEAVCFTLVLGDRGLELSPLT